MFDATLLDKREMTTEHWTGMMVSTHPTRIFLIALLLGIFCTASASAVCLSLPGDVNNDGDTNVVDIQCSILSTQFFLAAASLEPNETLGSIPGCVQENLHRTDANCDQITDVVDISLLTFMALEMGLSPLIDEDENLCVDNCQSKDKTQIDPLCGDGLCHELTGESCDNCPSDCGACEGDCCQINDTIGCQSPEITACACALYPECCESSWTADCAVATKPCGLNCSTAPSPSPCCNPQIGNVGCAEDSLCEACVCSQLPYCCEVAWDENCIAIGAIPCEPVSNPKEDGSKEDDSESCANPDSCWSVCHCLPQEPPEISDCCTDKDTPGCSSTECESCVCDWESTCCDIAWDGDCDQLAKGPCNEDCGCFPTSGSCCESNDNPGCGDFGCESCVCDVAPECCAEPWTKECANIAKESCQPLCECEGGTTPPPSCCAAGDEPGCPIPECEDCVCDYNSLCCDIAWDFLCVMAAEQTCEEECACNNPDCCSSKSGPGCPETICEDCVCNNMPECCDGPWNNDCSEFASTICSLNCGCDGSTGACCAAHPGPGCVDEGCEQCVCDLKDYCCGSTWGEDCAELARTECDATCFCPVQSDGDCCEVQLGGGCGGEPECVECVCALDFWCCDVQWDGTCTEFGGDECADECGCEADCCSNHLTAGCKNAICSDCVCDEDPICCELSWGQSCVELAEDTCKNYCGCEEETDPDDPEECEEEPCEEECGDGICGDNEDCDSCVSDCGACCGNGVCADDEDCDICPEDCGPCDPQPNGCEGFCGDLSPQGCFCDAGCVAAGDCCADACELCGFCDNEPGICGDGTCDVDIGEDCYNCFNDCCYSCGDAFCDEAVGENCETCPLDCGPCNPLVCSDEICGQEVDGVLIGCDQCPEHCCDGVCGNGDCESAYNEDCLNCPEDCPDDNGNGGCCGNGTCEASETCVECPTDCNDCGCGDGECNEAAGESCDSCPVDCGECKCGDGTCAEQDNENCLNCPQDCGDCKCDDYGDFTYENEQKVEEDLSSPYLLGTGAKTTVEGFVKASGTIGPDGCTIESSAGGSIKTCVSVLYQETCVEGSAEMGISCNFKLQCDIPPVFDCDPDTRCCEEYFTATLGVSRTLKAEKKFGPAGCEFHIGAGLEGSATTSESEGPGCDCPGNKDTLKATLTADAGGECKVEMFGLKVGAGGSLTGGACAGKVIAGGCEEGGGWFAGTFVEVKVGPVSFGWLGSFEYSKKWESGDDC